MATTPSVDRQTFLANLRQSGLLNDEQLTVAARQLPETNRGRLVARALVDQGILTKFQAERLLAGRTSGFVLGQYRILDELGQGGMGRVFKAIHKTMKRIVALKVLAPQFVDTEKAQLLFQREMRALAQLLHPNLVTAYDANQVGNRHYLVMEFVDGPNLDQLVRERGPLPVGQACEIIRQAAQGLQYAADMGMVHRDIKPSNLLVLLPGLRRKQYTVKILDFGLACLWQRDTSEWDGAGSVTTRSNTILGTPDFVSPEQAHDLHAVDVRSDLYSLGCTFHFLLTGQVPFPGGSTLEKLIRHSTEEPLSVAELRPEVPAGVAAVVRRLLAKDPADRFQTPAELAAALEPFAEVEQISWLPPRPIPPGTDPLITPLPETAPTSSSDVMAALVSTFPPDLCPTPISGTKLASASRLVAFDAKERQRVKLAIVLAIGIVAGALGLACCMSLW